jgi:hypothetical protein
MNDADGGRPARGLARDFQQARAGTKASADELREYVRQFRGKSPQEMLGLVTGSGLVRATVLATVLTVVAMAAFTIGPYAWKKMSPPTAKAAKSPPAAQAAAPAAPAPAAPVATAVAAPTVAKPVATAAAGPPSIEAIEALGLGEKSKAKPTKNPLDAGGDDLLKDLK